MKVKSIPSSWIARDGLRLDCNPYMSGALEARIRLEELPYPKDTLASLCSNGIDGIYHAGRESRSWVDDPDLGVPFLSSSSILAADLSGLPLISKKQVRRNPRFLIKKGWTLITRSGTIGRMVYSRQDMDGLACSEHVMRVVPDESKISPGYLYSFLSSKFGVPLVTSGTYGSIIQSIEPEHIAGLPVPRLGKGVEDNAHRLMQEASSLRAEAALQITKTVDELATELKLAIDEEHNVAEFSVCTVNSSSLNNRFDAPYHSLAAQWADKAVTNSPACTARLASVVRRYFKPPLFKRLWVDDLRYGRQFISGVDAYRYQAESDRLVSRKTPRFNEYILAEGMVIFQAAGQIYGLFGQPLFVSGWLTGLFAADDLYRLAPNSVSDGGFLFAFFRTNVGQILLKRQACGNSIPRIWDPQIRDIRLPWPDETLRIYIGAKIIDAHKKIEMARVAEVNAIALVENAIEGAS